MNADSGAHMANAGRVRHARLQRPCRLCAVGPVVAPGWASNSRRPGRSVRWAPFSTKHVEGPMNVQQRHGGGDQRRAAFRCISRRVCRRIADLWDAASSCPMGDLPATRKRRHAARFQRRRRWPADRFHLRAGIGPATLWRVDRDQRELLRGQGVSQNWRRPETSPSRGRKGPRARFAGSAGERTFWGRLFRVLPRRGYAETSRIFFKR